MELKRKIYEIVTRNPLARAINRAYEARCERKLDKFFKDFERYSEKVKELGQSSRDAGKPSELER
jgi:hypothetical protein